MRNFYKSLYVFLKNLSKLIDIDIYIYTTKEQNDKKFSVNTNEFSADDILKDNLCKFFAIDSSEIQGVSMLTQREQNTFHQWNKIHLCFNAIPKNKYNYIVRIRPDISIQITPVDFVKILATLEPSKLYIPNGNDLFTSKLILESPSINDQIAIADYETMKIYSDFYIYLLRSLDDTEPIISEVLLSQYLNSKEVNIHRFNLPYSLYLSDCSIIAICGNSGAGKSTVLEALKKVFPFDSNLQIETDRYHKWERESCEWKSYTHLNPYANNLEKMSDDTYLLKMGETVEMIDYDHRTGKFTAPVKVESKNFIFLCGLHTLYKDSLRSHLDFKVYIDTQEELNTYWKIRRDKEKRGHSIEAILKKIEERKLDYEQYIKPQRNHADCILNICYNGSLPSHEMSLDPTLLSYSIEIKSCFLNVLNKLLSHFAIKQRIQTYSVIYVLKSYISREAILDYAKKESIFIEDTKNLEEGYLGVLQLVVLQVTFK
jgi:uridine kinase